MKIINPLIFVSIVLQISCTNSKTEASANERQKEKIFKGKLKSRITSKHVQIPGCNLYLIPPNGFIVDTTTIQLKKGYLYFGRLLFLLENNRSKVLAGLRELADKNYPGSWHEEKFETDGHSAAIYSFKQFDTFQNYFGFTDGYTNDMIAAVYDSQNIALGNEMLTALKTVVVDK